MTTKPLTFGRSEPEQTSIWIGADFRGRRARTNICTRMVDFRDPGARERHAKKTDFFGKSQSKRKTRISPIPVFGPSEPAQT
jgi:hypothetical protein